MTTIVSTFGSSEANAYCSLTEAHSIVSARALDASAWTDASTATRIAAVLRATGDIDAVPWLGAPSRDPDTEQALAFPRTIVGLPARINALSEDTAFERERESLARACALHALWVLGDGDRDTHRRHTAAGVKQYAYKLDSLSETVSYDAPASAGDFAGLAPDAQTALADFPRARRLARA